MKASTYAWSAVAVSASMPLATFAWCWATYDFVNPDGSPDNAPIRSLPGLAIVGFVLWFTALSAFRILGRLQLRRSAPSLSIAAIFTSALAFLLSAAFYYLAVFAVPDDPMPAAAMAALGVFAFSWVSLGLGATTQLLRIRRVKWLRLAAMVVAVSGCGADELTAEKARALADEAMTRHCASDRRACDSLGFTKVSESRDGLWLAEYESKTQRYAVIVDGNGSVEITRADDE